MKKIYILLLILIVLTPIGCGFSKVNNAGVKEKVNIDNLIKYKGSYVGDNSAVCNILNKLPGSLYIKQISLETKDTPYGVNVNYGLRPDSSLTENDLYAYWTEENVKKIFLTNATTLFILIKNVDNVKFSLDNGINQGFSISRKDIETYYRKDLRQYAGNPSLWKSEILDGTLKSDEAIRNFFNTYHIITKK